MEGRRAIVVLDNATWQKVKRLHWHHFQLEYLPTHSLDLDAIEKLRPGWIAKSTSSFKTLIQAPRSLIQQPTLIQFQCRPRTWVYDNDNLLDNRSKRRA